MVREEIFPLPLLLSPRKLECKQPTPFLMAAIECNTLLDLNDGFAHMLERFFAMAAFIFRGLIELLPRGPQRLEGGLHVRLIRRGLLSEVAGNRQQKKKNSENDSNEVTPPQIEGLIAHKVSPFMVVSELKLNFCFAVSLQMKNVYLQRCARHNWDIFSNSN
jgi:hypothetical protein